MEGRIVELPRQPQYLTIAIRPDVDLQRQQMALLIFPPPVTSIHPEAEIKYLPAAEARMLDGLRRQMNQLDRPMVLVPSVPDGAVPPVFPMNGCRSCKHSAERCNERGSLGKFACGKRNWEEYDPWHYCEWHEEHEKPAAEVAP